jgi:phospholipid/cholesterol/gamma-HCH transport system substrate-binding protein
MRKTGFGREITVGTTLMLALVILAALILILGKESPFSARQVFTTSVTNSQGLKTGSPVLMDGVQIGTVEGIALPKEVGKSGIELELGVDRKYRERIREGSVASVGYITLLSGEKFINISPGDPERGVLPAGSAIPPDTSTTLLETGQNVAENLARVTSDVGDLVEEVNRGEGLVGRLVKDREFGQQVSDKLLVTLDRMNNVMDRIERGQGTVGRLVSDDQYATETLGSVKSAAARLDRVLDTIETKKGAIGELIREDGEGKKILEDLRETANSLKVSAAKLESEKGLIGRLLNDEAYSEAVASDLHRISSSLASIAEKIDKGEGTLGALINDPTVYQALKDITTGIRASGTARFILRHYGKKGVDEANKAKPAAPPPPAKGAVPPKPEPSPEGHADPGDRGEAPTPAAAPAEEAPGPSA